MAAAVLPLVLGILPEMPNIITSVVGIVGAVESLFKPNKKQGPTKKDAAMAMIEDLLNLYGSAETVVPKLPQVNTSDMNAALSQIIDGVVALNNAIGVFTH